MSSFVIGKEEYIKAAGICAGIASIKKMWVYDYIARRNMEPEDYYNRFSECYTMNALSVQEQYQDAEPETDPADYLQTFKTYQAKGRAAATNPEKLRGLILDLRDFFASAQYQTEKESYYFKMQALFNTILVALMPHMAPPRESTCWGSLDI